MENLRIIREKRNINQVKIAVDLKISQESISKYETGKAFPSKDILIKLADYLNCSIDYLLCKTDTRNPEKINIDEAEVSFLTGVKGLNETNKMIIKNTLEALLAKQEKDIKNQNEKGK